MLVTVVIGSVLFRSPRAANAIFSNGAQVVGVAFCATGQPRSLGKMKWNRWLGSARVFAVVLLNPNSVPLTLTLYHVACTSRPLKKVCGASSKPMLYVFGGSGGRLVASSRLVARPVVALT